MGQFVHHTISVATCKASGARDSDTIGWKSFWKKYVHWPTEWTTFVLPVEQCFFGLRCVERIEWRRPFKVLIGHLTCRVFLHVFEERFFLRGNAVGKRFFRSPEDFRRNQIQTIERFSVRRWRRRRSELNSRGFTWEDIFLPVLLLEFAQLPVMTGNKR